MDEPGSPDELTEEVPDEEPAGKQPKNVGSADELTDEVPDDEAPDKPAVVSARRRDGASSGRTSSRRRTAPPPSGGKNKAVIAVAVVVVLAVVAIIATQGGGSDESDPVDTTQSQEPAVDDMPTDPSAAFAKRFADLGDGDLAGREDLRDFCAKNDLEEELRQIQMEILLLNPDDGDARYALGFTRYTGENPTYAGLWLSDEDLRIAQSENH